MVYYTDEIPETGVNLFGPCGNVVLEAGDMMALIGYGALNFNPPYIDGHLLFWLDRDLQDAREPQQAAGDVAPGEHYYNSSANVTKEILMRWKDRDDNILGIAGDILGKNFIISVDESAAAILDSWMEETYG